MEKSTWLIKFSHYLFDNWICTLDPGKYYRKKNPFRKLSQILHTLRTEYNMIIRIIYKKKGVNFLYQKLEHACHSLYLSYICLYIFLACLFTSSLVYLHLVACLNINQPVCRKLIAVSMPTIYAHRYALIHELFHFTIPTLDCRFPCIHCNADWISIIRKHCGGEWWVLHPSVNKIVAQTSLPYQNFLVQLWSSIRITYTPLSHENLIQLVVSFVLSNGWVCITIRHILVYPFLFSFDCSFPSRPGSVRLSEGLFAFCGRKVNATALPDFNNNAIMRFGLMELCTLIANSKSILASGHPPL